jgi:hypothetical protein
MESGRIVSSRAAPDPGDRDRSPAHGLRKPDRSRNEEGLPGIIFAVFAGYFGFTEGKGKRQSAQQCAVQMQVSSPVFIDF